MIKINTKIYRKSPFRWKIMSCKQHWKVANSPNQFTHLSSPWRCHLQILNRKLNLLFLTAPTNKQPIASVKTLQHQGMILSKAVPVNGPKRPFNDLTKILNVKAWTLIRILWVLVKKLLTTTTTLVWIE